MCHFCKKDDDDTYRSGISTESANEPEVEQLTTPDNSRLELPDVPAGSRDSYFDHILIEYNRSPRHGLDVASADGEVEGLSDIGGEHSDGDGQNRESAAESSGDEIETEVM